MDWVPGQVSYYAVCEHYADRQYFITDGGTTAMQKADAWVTPDLEALKAIASLHPRKAGFGTHGANVAIRRAGDDALIQKGV